MFLSDIYADHVSSIDICADHVSIYVNICRSRVIFSIFLQITCTMSVCTCLFISKKKNHVPKYVDHVFLIDICADHVSSIDICADHVSICVNICRSRVLFRFCCRSRVPCPCARVFLFPKNHISCYNM